MANKGKLADALAPSGAVCCGAVGAHICSWRADSSFPSVSSLQTCVEIVLFFLLPFFPLPLLLLLLVLFLLPCVGPSIKSSRSLNGLTAKHHAWHKLPLAALETLSRQNLVWCWIWLPAVLFSLFYFELLWASEGTDYFINSNIFNLIIFFSIHIFMEIFHI